MIDRNPQLFRLQVSACMLYFTTDYNKYKSFEGT